jgi:hypothetical protein
MLRRPMGRPEAALEALSEALRAERSVVSPHVTEPGADEAPVLGLVAAAGPRASASPADYALIVEAVREGYLLHYGRTRMVAGDDGDLALLAGDYLYALGLERLAALGDLEAVRELSDLISLAAQVHAGDRDRSRCVREACALWLASAIALAAGGTEAHEGAKSALRSGSPDADRRLWAAARAGASADGLDGQLLRTADAIHCTAEQPS